LFCENDLASKQSSDIW